MSGEAKGLTVWELYQGQLDEVLAFSNLQMLPRVLANLDYKNIRNEIKSVKC